MEYWLLAVMQIVGFLFFLGVVYPKRILATYPAWCRGTATGLMVLRLLYAFSCTIYLWFLWARTNPLLLQLPVGPARVYFSSFFNQIAGGNGYFLYYIFWRYWLSAILSVIVALLVALVIYLIRKFYFIKAPCTISSSDQWLISTAVIIAGWPQFILTLIFIGLSSLAFVLVPKGRAKPQFELPVILSILLTLILGSVLANLLGLGVLNI